MPEAELTASAAARFRSRFGLEPAWVAAAPGRVNLVGEHVDYVGGLVLPAAVDSFVALAGGPGPRWRLFSEVAGGARYLARLGRELGAGPQRVAAAADLAAGRGLGSSAALLVAAARGLRPDLEAMAAAQACRRAEAAAGAPVGLMDHAASAMAREGHALLLDCATLERRHVRLPPGLALAVLDTGVTRRLAETPYAERRRAAEAAVAARGGSLGPGPDAGRDPVLRHLLSEVGRVRRFVAAAEGEDLEEMGRLVDESHASLRDDLRVSLPQVDSLVARARAAPGCLGARIMGAGFGGSVLALLREGAQDRFASAVGVPVTACRTTSGAFAA